MGNPANAAAGRLPLTPLRVFRVEPNTFWHIRTLSAEIGGLLTHYVKGRSVLCKGAECNAAYHRSQTYWKGYISADLWNQAADRWAPVVVEITEHLELDLRGIYQRGQVWELWREAVIKGKNSPVMGKMLEERNPDTFPSPYPIVPVLQHVYHDMEVELKAKNPLPDRILVKENAGDGPKILQGDKTIETPMSTDEFNAKMEEMRNRLKTPTEKRLKL